MKISNPRVQKEMENWMFNRKSTSYISLISLSYTFLLDFFGFGQLAR